MRWLLNFRIKPRTQRPSWMGVQTWDNGYGEQEFKYQQSRENRRLFLAGVLVPIILAITAPSFINLFIAFGAVNTVIAYMTILPAVVVAIPVLALARALAINYEISFEPRTSQTEVSATALVTGIPAPESQSQPQQEPKRSWCPSFGLFSRSSAPVAPIVKDTATREHDARVAEGDRQLAEIQARLTNW